MTRYIFRRVIFLGLTVLLTSLLVFLITRWLPGDVCRIILGREAGEAALAACRVELGLNEPGLVQYLGWLGDLIRGDWGISYSTRSAILPLLIGRLRNSLMLAGVTFILAIPISVALGVLAGLNENKLVDQLINIATLSVVGLPEFVTGIILIQVFAFGLKLLPANSSITPGASFRETFPMLVLPAITATLVLLAYIARQTRIGVVGELKKDYVRTARLKGLPERVVIVQHVLRNAILPTITVIAISTAWLFSGLIVIENVYNYPGLGRLLVFAIDRRDLPLLQAITIVTVIGYALSNLLADILYAVFNPRIRYR